VARAENAFVSREHRVHERFTGSQLGVGKVDVDFHIYDNQWHAFWIRDGCDFTARE
jgi:hypothetical protein